MIHINCCKILFLFDVLNHFLKLFHTNLDDSHGIVHVARVPVVNRDNLVVLLDPEPGGLAARHHPRHKDARVLLLVLVEAPVDKAEAEAPVAPLDLDDSWPHGWRHTLLAYNNNYCLAI